MKLKLPEDATAECAFDRFPSLGGPAGGEEAWVGAIDVARNSSLVALRIVMPGVEWTTFVSVDGHWTPNGTYSAQFVHISPTGAFKDPTAIGLL